MKIQSRKILWKAFEIIDIAILMTCFLLTVAIFNYPGSMAKFGQILGTYLKVSDIAWVFLLAVSWHLCLVAFGLYHNKRFSSIKTESFDIFKALSVFIVIYIITSLLFNRSPHALRFIFVFWSISFGVMIASRSALRIFQRIMHRQNRNLRFVLIAGTNERAIDFARKIQSNPELGFRLAGFIDDEWHGMKDFREEGFSTVSSLAGIQEYLRHHVVDEVFVALPVHSFYTRIDALVAVCEEHGIVVHYMQDFFNHRSSQAESVVIGDTAVIRRVTGNMMGWKLGIKRMLDFLCALVLIILLSPVFLATAIAIKRSSPGPVFFRQKRLGLNKRLITMYKFRTMVENAEQLQGGLEEKNEVSGPVFKIKKDPRVTGVGAFLRKTSLDELPQLFNVLTGDMSIIGPRPLPVRDYSGFPNDRFRRRLSVKPGITCIWQASGRNNISFDRWMEMDLAYIDKWSLSFDFNIFLRTVVSVLRTTGAS